MHTVAHRVFRFEGFALDMTRGCLHCGDRQIELRPKSFEVLQYLIENADRLVTKDELIGAIWPNVFVTDDSLTRCISDVRQALGDAEQRIIKTMPRRGYLFAAPVSEALTDTQFRSSSDKPSRAPSNGDTAPPPEPERPERSWTPRRRSWIALGAAAVLIAAIGASVWFSRQPAGLPLPDRPSIAVLPFTNMSADAQQEYFSDGVSEDIITALSKFRDLFVIARNSSFTYKGKPFDVKQIGRELGVRYLLEGSVRRDAERLRITAQLIDSASGRHIWADYYDRDPSGIFAVQDEVTQRIVSTLVAHIGRLELERALHKPPQTLAAYDYYLRGNAAMKAREGPNRGEMVAAARAFYEQSIAADPRYAPAIQGVANTYITAWLEPTSYEPITRQYRQQGAIELALSLARRAVELDPHLPEAHATHAWVLHWHYRRAEAIAAFERAFELNPNLADGRIVLVLYQNGRAPESLERMKRIMRNDPFPPAVYSSYLGNAYYLTGQYERALESLRVAAARMPGYRAAFAWLAATSAQLGRLDEARAAAAEVLRVHPEFTISWFLGQIRLTPRDAEHLTEGLRKAGLPN
jgi:adenylate cyclase